MPPPLQAEVSALAMEEEAAAAAEREREGGRGGRKRGKGGERGEKEEERAERGERGRGSALRDHPTPSPNAIGRWLDFPVAAVPLVGPAKSSS